MLKLTPDLYWVIVEILDKVGFDPEETDHSYYTWIDDKLSLVEVPEPEEFLEELDKSETPKVLLK